MSQSPSSGLRVVAPLAILAVGIFGYVGLSSLKSQSPSEPKQTEAPLVETVEAISADDGLTIGAHGTVVPFREIPLPTEVAGRIEFKHPDAKPGRFVEKGVELFRIDAEDYQLEVERIEKEQAQALANVAEVKQQILSTAKLLVLAKEEFEEQHNQFLRVERLFKDGVATENQFDNAKQTRRQANSALVGQQNEAAVLEKRLHRFEKAYDLTTTMLKKAKLDLERTRIVAPVTGVIVREHAEQDAFVQRGAELLAIMDTSAAEVQFDLRMKDLYWLWQHEANAQTSEDLHKQSVDASIPSAETWEVPEGIQADVVYELGGRRFKWSGKLARYEGTGLNERTRTVPCRVLVDEPTKAILLPPRTIEPIGNVRNSDAGSTQRAVSKTRQSIIKAPPALVRGMFVSIEIKTQPRVSIVSIPERAVRPGNIVWRVVDGKLERLKVEVARVARGRALIPGFANSIQPGDQIVVSPLPTETSGQRVRVQQIDRQ